jgi:hypothetical protein
MSGAAQTGSSIDPARHRRATSAALAAALYLAAAGAAVVLLVAAWSSLLSSNQRGLGALFFGLLNLCLADALALALLAVHGRLPFLLGATTMLVCGIVLVGFMGLFEHVPPAVRAALPVVLLGYACAVPLLAAVLLRREALTGAALLLVPLAVLVAAGLLIARGPDALADRLGADVVVPVGAVLLGVALGVAGGGARATDGGRGASADGRRAPRPSGSGTPEVLARWAWDCPVCGVRNPPGTGPCRSCGGARAEGPD